MPELNTLGFMSFLGFASKVERIKAFENHKTNIRNFVMGSERLAHLGAVSECLLDTSREIRGFLHATQKVGGFSIEKDAVESEICILTEQRSCFGEGNSETPNSWLPQQDPQADIFHATS